MSIQAVNPGTGEAFGPLYAEASLEEIAEAALRAREAFQVYRAASGARKADFLEGIAREIEAQGESLLRLCQAETGLPPARLAGERARTCAQLRLFAALVREGSWVDARIDLALPDRTPVPRPDLRRMLIALGPVAVFGASNFPLAFSVAGGDTASALAAGCPVVFKAHPAHPGTSAQAGAAIARAAGAAGLPPGVFALLQGGPAVGAALVRHPAISAVGFTGSQAAGRALFDAAAARPEPIPVFAEMGSVNPLVVLPGALAERGPSIAEALFASFTLGVGQFCTKPGLVFVREGRAAEAFVDRLARLVREAPPGHLLTPGLCRGFEDARARALATGGVTRHGAEGKEPAGKLSVAPAFADVPGETFLREPGLAREVFGPFCLVVRCASDVELAQCLQSLDGQLTATLHGNAEDLARAAPWIAVLERKAGRLLVNGFPTGVEVSPAMNHGGPYPATTDARQTSVGTASILRFARPVCYQNFPPELLPPELQDRNPLGLLRWVNGAPTRDPVVR